MKVLQLYINCCFKDSGEVFDFNTQPYEQSEGFKATLIHLSLPNHHSPIYYFIHRSTNKYEDKLIQIERSKQFKSDIHRSKLSPKNYILMGGIKLYYQQNSKGNNELVMQCFSGKDIPTDLDNFENKQDGLPYMIAKTFKNGIPLKQHQVIKLGRSQFNVMEVHQKPNKQQYLNSISPQQIMNLDSGCQTTTEQGYKSKQITNVRKTNVDDVCRICHCDDQQDNDPLIHPCKCTQSIGSVHITCFKQWMNVKMSKMKGEANGTAFHTNLLCCQICKQKLPKAIKINGETMPILNLFDDFHPYFGLVERTSLTKGEMDTNDNIIYVAMDQKNKVDIGRMMDNGVILNEITVSRKHAQVVLENDKFYIKDLNSKFGTLVYEKDKKVRLSNNMKAFQIKNFAFSIKIVNKQL